MTEGPLERAPKLAQQGAGLGKAKVPPGPAEPIAAAFGEYLARELRAHNWTIRALGLRSGVDHSTISRLMRGQRAPTLRTASRLSEALRGPRPGSVPAGAAGVAVGKPVDRVAAALGADPSLSAHARSAVLSFYVQVRTSGHGSGASVPED